MKEKIIASPAENGEYLISPDVADRQIGTGKNKRYISTMVFSVFFRKNGIEDWESVNSFETMKKAEDFVKGEIAKASCK